MKITKSNVRLSSYMVAINSDKLKELGYEYDTRIAAYIKKIPYTEVFDDKDDFDDSWLYIEVTSNGDLRVRYNWELDLRRSQANGNYGGFIEVSIIDEFMELNTAGLLIKRV